MKKTFCIFLILCVFLSGCSYLGNHIKAPVHFYYLCSRYQEDLCCVINSEEREASGHYGDLNYLLALYLMGPIDDELQSPLPGDVQILSIQKNGDALRLELPDLDSVLTDADFSVASACLTMTCLDITDVSSVTVLSGTRSVMMSKNSISLSDGSMEPTTKE